ncbi:hypothetical protein BDA96_09G091100 [Sorghum bicolor]|uniref:Uncharacterized protein n=1 Tax=Sorghum bicolor TaxID=4558 RepID=A0A921Q8Z6_SORBI|nr:hypothetical protein BDA96_09G091100 [Sorghum bicolor]
MVSSEVLILSISRFVDPIFGDARRSMTYVYVFIRYVRVSFRSAFEYIYK